MFMHNDKWKAFEKGVHGYWFQTLAQWRILARKLDQFIITGHNNELAIIVTQDSTSIQEKKGCDVPNWKKEKGIE